MKIYRERKFWFNKRIKDFTFDRKTGTIIFNTPLHCKKGATILIKWMNKPSLTSFGKNKYLPLWKSVLFDCFYPLIYILKTIKFYLTKLSKFGKI